MFNVRHNFIARATRLFHLTSYALSKRGGKQFAKATTQVEITQYAILKNLLSSIEGSQSASIFGLEQGNDLYEFQQKVPVTDYEDWQALIEKQQGGEDNVLSQHTCERYQPTSGSTSKIKWIPYNRAFLNELDRAISPWMTDLYQQYPKINQGKHYWSLSWVPSDLRNKLTASINDDLQLLPWWKSIFMAQIMAVPEAVSLAKTSEESSFATACYLVACRDLSFISVWSPTFALSLLELIKQNRYLIQHVLEKGAWLNSQSGLAYLKAPKSRGASQVLKQWNGNIDAEFTQNLWPELVLISAWDTSSSEIWAKKLAGLFPHSEFQGKGLWATEGVVSFPYQSNYPLAITSHFYEFEDLDNKQIYTSWQLRTGQNVRPIISTANGLLRYGMKDQLKVTGYINECPCFEFIGRLNGIDMVGEKISPEIAVNIINDMSSQGDISAISLLGMPSNNAKNLPSYALLCLDESSLSQTQNSVRHAELSYKLEAALCECFHYKLARELGQLDQAQVLVMANAMEVYTSHKVARGMVAGNIKIEPLVLWQNEILPEGVESDHSETLLEWF